VAPELAGVAQATRARIAVATSSLFSQAIVAAAARLNSSPYSAAGRISG
jgi:hypothetical protein